MGLLKKKNKNDIQQETKKIDEISGLIDTASLDSIYPFVFKENKGEIEAGGNYVKVICFAEYPKKPRGNWLKDLKRIKGNITISRFIEPANSAEMINHYNNTIKNKRAEELRTHDPKILHRIGQEIKAAEYQLKQALDNESTFVNIHTYLLLQADSEDNLKSLEDNVKRVLTKLRIKGVVPYYKMEDAYWSSLPIGMNMLSEYTYQMSNTTAASSLMSWDDTEICDLRPRSLIEGFNKKSGSPVAINYLDKRRTLNQNKVVIGTSGVGKTTYMFQCILRLIALGGARIFIIDPENEYSHIVEYLGGTVIHLSSSSDTIVNPLQIFSVELDADDDANENKRSVTDDSLVEKLIKQKINRLKGFFKVITDNALGKVELSIIETVMMNLYSRFREIKDINKMTNEDWPILEDLYNALGKLKTTNPDEFKYIEEFWIILKGYVHGATTLFNGYTNLDLNTDLVSFDLKPLQTETDVQGACYLNTFSFLWDEITKDRTQLTYLFGDEIHFVLQNKESANFFYQAFKRFRKYNAGATVGTQQIQDVLNAPDNIGPAIVGNSYTKVFFGLDNIGVDDIITKLKMNFSKEEKSLLSAKRQGEALIIYGSQRVFMQVKLTEEELRLINPVYYEDKYERQANEQPDYMSRVYISPLEYEELKIMGE
ncbi:DUF87 domain-containing protein [Bacillus subtilis]|uniref:VirB4 family type IV secretion system protein n=1 Tax=Bacillus subtilis TaxID=1423 RepID=UPI002041CFC9|nr:DUF87 domain-containing protein [Bacillus subtilis]MCM3191289.1 DUF87 domain-containing protein [Bacillus subtilis]